LLTSGLADPFCGKPTSRPVVRRVANALKLASA